MIRFVAPFTTQDIRDCDMVSSAPVDYASVTEVPREIGRDQFEVITRRYALVGSLAGGRRVLEVGCGSGFGLGHLAARSRMLAAGDMTASNLTRVLRTYRGRPGIRPLRFDAHRLPFRSGSFDLVAALAVTYYLDLDRFLEECRRLLAADGTLVFCQPNPDATGFHRSPRSIRYCAAHELGPLLSRHGYDVRLFGGFPAGTAKAGILRRGIALGGGLLRLFAFAPEFQGRLHRASQRLLGYETVALPGELREEDLARVRDIPLAELPGDRRDARHRILYVVARRRS